MSHDNDLFDQIGNLLESRRGWIFEPSSTPGMPPFWCLESGGEIELSVSADSGTISIYLPKQDQEIAIDNVEALITWIDKNEQRFLRS